jgi:hypothetical protein
VSGFCIPDNGLAVDRGLIDVIGASRNLEHHLPVWGVLNNDAVNVVFESSAE